MKNLLLFLALFIVSLNSFSGCHQTNDQGQKSDTGQEVNIPYDILELPGTIIR